MYQKTQNNERDNRRKILDRNVRKKKKHKKEITEARKQETKTKNANI